MNWGSAFPQSDNLPVNREGRKFYLSWSHYLILMRITDENERHFYEIETYRNGWSKDELSRQYGSSLYERLSLSRDKDEIMKLAMEGQTIESPKDIFKDPYVLEFTGLPELVTYNRFLRCFVLFDLKIGQLKHQDIGQMQIFASRYQTVLPSKEELKQMTDGKLSNIGEILERT